MIHTTLETLERLLKYAKYSSSAEKEAITVVHALHKAKWDEFFKIREINRGQPNDKFKNGTLICYKIPISKPSVYFAYPRDKESILYKQVQIYNSYVRAIRKATPNLLKEAK